MKAQVRKAIADKRGELVAKVATLRSQYQDAQTSVNLRKTELDLMEAALIELDEWLGQNPPGL